MKPFFQRLGKYYSDVARVLRNEADVATIFPNPGDIGTSRERIYAEVLKLHIPSSCNVFLGGFLFDVEGNESKQLDIIITNDSSLQFNFHNKDGSGKAFACIDGCLGIVSVKSMLDSAALVDSLLNIASIPDKQPLSPQRLPSNLRIPTYDDWPFKIVYASDGMMPSTINAKVVEFYEAHPEIPPNKRPNLIHIAGKYALFRAWRPDLFLTGEDKPRPVNSWWGTNHSPDLQALAWVTAELQQRSWLSKYLVLDYNNLISAIHEAGDS